MAVFTTFSHEALDRYLTMFDIGELMRFEPITSGIENSNYFVTMDQSGEENDYVLTVTEGLSFEQVPFFNELFSRLARDGLPVPNPVRTLDGMASTIFCGKPTWLFPRLSGVHPHAATVAQCTAIGDVLGRIHLGTQSLRYSRENPYDLDWMTTTFNAHQGQLAASDAALLSRNLHDYAQLMMAHELPGGIIHGDLFRDNALFDGDRLTGAIDFYHACRDVLVQDVAIALNDWCSTFDGAMDPQRIQALLAAYQQHRELTKEEWQALPVLQRAGAMRFVLTRLLSGNGEAPLKDPEEFLRIVRQLGQNNPGSNPGSGL